MKRIFFCILCIYICAGCYDDSRLPIEDQGKSLAHSVTLTLMLPPHTDMAAPLSTRAGADENSIENLYAYVEQPDGTLLRPVKGTGITKLTVSGGEIKYNATFKFTDGNASRVHFIANMPDADKEFASVAEMQKYTGRTLAENTSPAMPLLMSGKVELTGSVTSAESYAGLKLKRAAARICVEIERPTGLTSDFVLESIYLVRSADRGTAFGPDNEPSLPEGVSYLAKGATATSADQNKTPWVYAYEHKNTDTKDAVYIIMYGKYKNESCYYRLDFFDKSTKKYISLLRNHAYHILVKEITRKGYPTAEEASKYPYGVEQSFTITDDGITNIVANGHWMFGVSDPDVVWGGNTTVDFASFKTNYPIASSATIGVNTGKEFDIKILQKPDWITDLSYKESPTSPGTYILTGKFEWKTGFSNDRTGKITIKVGDLERTLVVKHNLNTLLPVNIFLSYEYATESESPLVFLHPVDKDFTMIPGMFTMVPDQVYDYAKSEDLNFAAISSSASTTMTGQVKFSGLRYEDASGKYYLKMKTFERNNNGGLSLEATVMPSPGKFGGFKDFKIKVVQSHFPDGLLFDGLVGIYRADNDNATYDVSFGNMYGDYTIEVPHGDDSWIHLYDRGGQPLKKITGSTVRWDGIERPRYSKEASTIRFKYKLDQNSTSADRFGRIRITYNNNQCTHDVYVHQGFRDIEWLGYDTRYRYVNNPNPARKKYVWQACNLEGPGSGNPDLNGGDTWNPRTTDKPTNPGKLFLFRNERRAWLYADHRGGTQDNSRWGYGLLSPKIYDEYGNYSYGGWHGSWWMGGGYWEVKYSNDGWGESGGGKSNNLAPAGYIVPSSDDFEGSFFAPAGRDANNNDPNGKINAISRQQVLWGAINHSAAKTWDDWINTQERAGCLVVDLSDPANPKTIFFPGGGRRLGVNGRLQYRGRQTEGRQGRYKDEGACYWQRNLIGVNGSGGPTYTDGYGKFVQNCLQGNMSGLNIYHDPDHKIGFFPVVVHNMEDQYVEPANMAYPSSANNTGDAMPGDGTRYGQEGRFVRCLKKGVRP